MPLLLEAEALFTCPTTSRDIRCRLPPLYVRLEDYFVALSSAPHTSYHSLRQKLRSRLGSDDNGDAPVVESRKSVAVGGPTTLDLLRERLGRQVCCTHAGPEASLVVDVGCRLPPSFALLLRFTVGDGSTAVELLTDCWPLLRHADAFLEELLLPGQLA